jgi:signal peptidase I
MSVRAVAVRVAMVALAAAAAAWACVHFGAVYVAGESMAPALRRGDLVVYARDARVLREGDIVWVAKPGWPDGVLHRVREVLLDDRLVLQGDANPVPDLQPVDPSSVQGVVRLVVPTGHLVGVVVMLARMVQSPATS